MMLGTTNIKFHLVLFPRD